MNRWRLLAAGLFLGTLVVGAATGQEAKGKAAKTPEEAVKNVVEAARKGDAEGVISQFVKPVRELMQRSKGLEEPQRQLNEALDAKFGKDPQAKQRPPFKEQITSLKAAEVKSSAKKGDHLVVLKIKTTAVKDGKEETKEETMGAVKEGDAWKLLPPGRDGTVDENTLKQVTAQTVQFTAQIPKIKEAMEKITKEVKDGKYKSREEAQKALDEFLKGKK